MSRFHAQDGMVFIDPHTGEEYCQRCSDKMVYDDHTDYRQVFGMGDHCQNCGAYRHGIVRKSKRNRPIGGKRGRNSGTTRSSKNK